MAASKRTPVEKAAMLLLAFGEDIAGEIFKNLTENEIRRLSGPMSQLGRIEQSEIDQVMAEFYSTLQTKTSTLEGSVAFTQNVLNKALGEKGAEALGQEILGQVASMESVHLIEAEGLARLIRNEHPQTITLVLAYCDPKKAGEVLKHLPEALHTEVILRLSRLETVPAEMVQEVDDHLREEITRMGQKSSRKLGGSDKVAAILAAMKKPDGDRILESLDERDAELTEDIRRQMFTFEDLIRIDDKGIREILAQAGQAKLLLALKTSSKALLERFLGNMSERARKAFLEDREAMPKSRLSDIEDAQADIVALTEGLIAQGKIVILSDEDKVV